MMDRDVHRFVHFLKYNESATGLDLHLLGIFDVGSAMKRALNHGYHIKKKTKGTLWKRNTIYYLENPK
jgi:hypothetical protein